MVNLPAVIIANGVGVALMAVLLLSGHKNARNVFFDEKLFFAMAVLTIVLCLSETASFCMDGKLFPLARGINIFLNSLIFCLNMVFCYVWVVYVDYKLFESMERLRRRALPMAVPALVIIAMSAANLFVDVFFTVTEENVYIRTSLAPLTYLVTYGYLIGGALEAYGCRRKAQKYLFMPVLVFLVPIFLGSLLQLLFYGVALIWVTVAVGVVSLYINIQNEASAVDPLTGLYNRQYCNRYLNCETRQTPPPGRRLAGILLDVDAFKIINDTCGHVVGDAALRDVGRVLHRAVSDQDFVARYAGDEFVVFRWVEREEEIRELLAAIRAECARFNGQTDRPYRLFFSMGAAFYDARSDTVESFLVRMDRAMYREKRDRGRTPEQVIPGRTPVVSRGEEMF